MVKSIQELHDKIEKNESKRLHAGKEFTTLYTSLTDKLRFINECSSDEYRYYVLGLKEFCVGFLHGMLCSHYITKDEFRILRNEIISVYDAYGERAIQELQERLKSSKVKHESTEISFSEMGVTV